MYSINKSKGFSLIELLTVVSIIAILSSMAVISFMKTKRQGKTTEAKILLSNLYGNERIFYIDNNNYHYNLEAINLDLVGKYIYNVGFDKSPIDGGTSCPTSGIPDCAIGGTANGTGNSNTFEVCGKDFASGSSTECFLKESNNSTKNTAVKNLSGACITGSLKAKVKLTSGKYKQYTALACADLGGGRLDVWSIDQRKDLQHKHDGTK